MMNISKTIDHINKYIASRGYRFSKGTVENLYLSLKSKPFVILCGPHGAGKYSLARLFCESINITSDNGRFKFVSPNLSSDKTLNPMGYINDDGKFCPGEVFDFIIKASNDSENPYVMFVNDLDCVNSDEYLKEILKIMDTAKRDVKDNLKSEYVFSKSFFQNEEDAELYGSIMYPENLYIICSICRGDECYVLSQAIKDRTNIIEITPENLDSFPDKINPCEILTDINNDFMKPTLFGKSFYDKTDYSERIVGILQEINKILVFYGREFGYRTRNEIIAYLITNSKCKILSDDDAIDNCIMQRILPRIEGNGGYCKNILTTLFKQCVTKGVGDYYANSLKMFRALSYPDCRYRKSARKITLMTRRIEESGFCTF